MTIERRDKKYFGLNSTTQELVPYRDGETHQPEHSVILGMKNLVSPQRGEYSHYFIVYVGDEINSADNTNSLVTRSKN